MFIRSCIHFLLWGRHFTRNVPMHTESQPSQYFARKTEDGSRRQWLHEHLRNVGSLARSFARDACVGNAPLAETAYLTGLLHDLGKYREEFQELLDGKRPKDKETAHSIYGASAVYSQFASLAGAFAIAGHHAGLANLEHLAQLVSGSGFQAQDRFRELVRRAEAPQELGNLPSITAIGFDENDDRDKRRYEFLTRMFFSMLVDADRLDSERFEQEHRLGRPWKRQAVPLQAEWQLERLQEARRQKAANRPADELNRLRNAIFDACVQCGTESPPGFFTLTVPTGGAKTLSSMAFALAHANSRHLRRVIVVIPYLSIIEQNAREYRTILGADHVLEHHSAVELPAISGDPAQASYAELAMENWDVPVVVTTSVQFIETLFAASPSRARRLHNIAQSVVIFDEVQTLPVHLLEPTLDVLRDLQKHFGVSFVFCSATQPGFRKSPGLKQGLDERESREIVPDRSEAYQNLRRVRYHIEPTGTAWDWSRLASEMLRTGESISVGLSPFAPRKPRSFAERKATLISAPVLSCERSPRRQALCVLNLRRHAFAAWDAVRRQLIDDNRKEDVQGALFHLSSAMCPAHRLDLLGLSRKPPPNNIARRLKSKKPCWVVSTQLIEAGVDVDFPLVFRAMGPLDSIVQAGGRCNREGLLTDELGSPVLGEVVVFQVEDGGLPRGIYETATNITPAYLADTEKMATDAAVFANYFTELYQLTPTDHARRGEHTIQEDRAAFNFRTVAERARVIQQGTRSVIVPYGRANNLVAKIRKTRRFDRATLRRLQRYMVNLRQGPGSDYETLTRIGATEPLMSDVLEIPVLAEHCYDAQRGVVIKELAPEDYFQ